MYSFIFMLFNIVGFYLGWDVIVEDTSETNGEYVIEEK